VPDVKNSHAIIQHSVKDLVWISNERNDVDHGSIGNTLCRRRMLGYVPDNNANSGFKRGGYSVAEPKAVGGYVMKVGNGSIGIFDLHARRKARNAACTCS
jgi:hypothetical protein